MALLAILSLFVVLAEEPSGIMGPETPETVQELREIKSTMERVLDILEQVEIPDEEEEEEPQPEPVPEPETTPELLGEEGEGLAEADSPSEE